MKPRISRRRGAQFVRTWNLLVLLQLRPWKVRDLADHFHVTERTIRRDLDALVAVGLPILSSRDDAMNPDAVVFELGPLRAWPKGDALPTAPLQT